jgi:hypothetical protein
MIHLELKSDTEISSYYDTFDDFELEIRKWYRSRINPKQSAMEYIFENYYVYVDTTRLRP